MRNVKTFEAQTGYGHTGIRVNLSIADEYAIANQIKNLETLQGRFKGVEMDYWMHVDPATGTLMQDAQAAISQINNFLRKMTTVNLVENDLFSESVQEETEKGE